MTIEIVLLTCSLDAVGSYTSRRTNKFEEIFGFDSISLPFMDNTNNIGSSGSCCGAASCIMVVVVC